MRKFLGFISALLVGTAVLIQAPAAGAASKGKMCPQFLRLCKDGEPATINKITCAQSCPDDPVKVGKGGGDGGEKVCPAIAMMCPDGSPATYKAGSCDLVCNPKVTGVQPLVNPPSAPLVTVGSPGAAK